MLPAKEVRERPAGLGKERWLRMPLAVKKGQTFDNTPILLYSVDVKRLTIALGREKDRLPPMECL